MNSETNQQNEQQQINNSQTADADAAAAAASAAADPPSTPALSFLTHHGVSYSIHRFAYVPNGGTAVSSHALGVPESEVVKTLLFADRYNPVPFIVLMHGNLSVDLKLLHKCLSWPGLKKGALSMCPIELAEAWSGYKVGGTSPFGTKREMKIFIEDTILQLPFIFINGGGRGLLVRVAVGEVVRTLAPVAVRCQTKQKTEKLRKPDMEIETKQDDNKATEEP